MMIRPHIPSVVGRELEGRQAVRQAGRQGSQTKVSLHSE